MPPKTTQDDVEDVPGWETPVEREPDPLPPGTQLHHPDQSTPQSPGPSTTSIPPSPPEIDGDGRSRRQSWTSSRTSTPDKEVVEGLAVLAGGLVKLLGIATNRLMRRRDSLWETTEQEEQAIGGSLANIAARRLPDELVEGDGADLFVIGSTAVGYGIRNTMGIDRERLEEPQREGTPRRRPPEPEDPGPPVMAEKRSIPEATPPPQPPPGVSGTMPAEPGPPSVISPDM